MAFVILTDPNFVHVCLLSPVWATVCSTSLPSQACLSLPARGWRDEDVGGGLGGWRRRLCGTALSPRTLFCQPSATDQQSASQPCTDLIPLSLSPFLSPSISLSLAARGTCCPHVSFLRQLPVLLPTVHVCLATSLPAFLSAALHACLSLYLLFLQSSCLSAFVSVSLSMCMGACLSICLSACQPLFLANTSLSESGQAVSRSANLPDYLPVYSSSVCVFICLPARLSACLPVCLSICLLSVSLPVLLSVCLRRGAL